mgnify:CR=1 FL=1
MQNHSYALLNSKKRTDLLQHLNQCLRVFDGIVDATGCAVGCVHAEVTVDRLCAMMSDTNGDALRIDELSNIMRMHAVDFKSHRADALLVGLRSENAHAVDLPPS